MEYKVFLVEDDEIIATQIKKFLITWGYKVQVAMDFNDVLKEFADFNPHIVLLDISLPFYNGYYWCGEIRKISKVPIVFLSSSDDNMNIVMAMNMGGDDFIAKPFDLQVLGAKIQAILRRTYDFNGTAMLLECKGAILNLANASLVIGEKRLELTKNEFRILEILFENKGKIVTREAIMKHLWDGDCFVDDNTLAVNFTRLRKKLDEVSMKDFITTKKGIGYLLEV